MPRRGRDGAPSPSAGRRKRPSRGSLGNAGLFLALRRWKIAIVVRFGMFEIKPARRPGLAQGLFVVGLFRRLHLVIGLLLHLLFHALGLVEGVALRLDDVR